MGLFSIREPETPRNTRGKAAAGSSKAAEIASGTDLLSMGLTDD